MSSATVRIAYDGPEVEKGSMDAKDLAPALLAVSCLLEEANRVLNEDRASVKVLIRSDFKSGSFEIVLDIIHSLAEGTKTLLGVTKDMSAAEIVGLVGLASGTGISLIKLIKRLKGKKITKATVIETGNCRIETEGDYDSIEVSEEIVKLYRDKRLRESAKGMLAPLSRPGIDRFIVRERTNDVEIIEKSEIDYFEVPAIPDEELVTSTRRGAFNVIGVFFDEHLKWRLYDGENRINATMMDKDFLKEMDYGRISFTKGDILEVDLRTRQWKSNGGLKTEHEIVKVIKQHKAFMQIPIPFDEERKDKDS